MKKSESFIMWFLQIGAMVSDILIILACFIFMIAFPILGIFLTIFTFYAWKTTGGFIAWTRRKQFMKNFKEMMEVKNDTGRR